MAFCIFALHICTYGDNKCGVVRIEVGDSPYQYTYFVCLTDYFNNEGCENTNLTTKKSNEKDIIYIIDAF